MNLILKNHQQGAVLAFSLVMLLLLTLVSVNMIQQNKSQIAMTSNSTQQTAAFSTVEAALGKAQTLVVQQRNTVPVTDNKCQSATSTYLHEGATLALGIPGTTGRITKVFCLSNVTGLPGQEVGDENQCRYNAGIRNLIVGTGTPAADADNVDACTRLNHAGIAGTSAQNCNSEIYTVNITFVNTTTSTTRTVESKLAVRCSGDIL